MFFIPRSRGFSPSFAMFDTRWQPPLYPLICALRSKWLRLECGGLPDETKGFAMWKCSIVFFGGSKQYHVLVDDDGMIWFYMILHKEIMIWSPSSMFFSKQQGWLVEMTRIFLGWPGGFSSLLFSVSGQGNQKLDHVLMGAPDPYGWRI